MKVDKIKKNNCTGCGACENICTRKCISMQLDKEGFRYPHINETKCIDCGKCYSICRERTNCYGSGGRQSEYPYALAAYAKDKVLLENSSSGGIFGLLAYRILEMKGIVYGVSFENMRCSTVRIHKTKELKKIQKSKYLQSHMGLAYQNVKNDLKMGRKVLFSGTPCQIAGLYAYLEEDYPGLYTCDVVCHGVPSEKVFQKYIEYSENKHGNILKDFVWRDKRKGWSCNSLVEYFADGSEQTANSMTHPFQRGFLLNMYLRPSCYECEFTGIPRRADLSLADYWNSELHDLELKTKNHDSGMSIVVVSSSKGETLVKEIRDDCIYKELSIDVVKECSRHFYLPPEQYVDRQLFFEDLDKKTFDFMISHYIFKN